MAHLDLDITDGVATLTMNRPEARNSLSMEMRAQLIEVLHDIEHNDTLRCVVLKGAGDHFMAGGDVKGMSESIKKTPPMCAKNSYFVFTTCTPLCSPCAACRNQS